MATAPSPVRAPFTRPSQEWALLAGKHILAKHSKFASVRINTESGRPRDGIELLTHSKKNHNRETSQTSIANQAPVNRFGHFPSVAVVQRKTKTINPTPPPKSHIQTKTKQRRGLPTVLYLPVEEPVVRHAFPVLDVYGPSPNQNTKPRQLQVANPQGYRRALQHLEGGQ